MANEVERNAEGMVEWLRDCGIVRDLSRERIALLIAAVRADERARCERAIVALGGRHDALNEDEAQGYEIALTRALEAVRNAE